MSSKKPKAKKAKTKTAKVQKKQTKLKPQPKAKPSPCSNSKPGDRGAHIRHRDTDLLTRSEMVKLRQVLREPYKLSSSELTKTATCLMSILGSKRATDRHKIMACRTLVSLRQYNLELLRTALGMPDADAQDGVLRVCMPLPSPRLAPVPALPLAEDEEP